MGNNPNNRFERLMNSGMPNFITMQNMTTEERIALLNGIVSKSRKAFIQKLKDKEKIERTKAAAEKNKFRTKYFGFNST